MNLKNFSTSNYILESSRFLCNNFESQNIKKKKMRTIRMLLLLQRRNFIERDRREIDTHLKHIIKDFQVFIPPKKFPRDEHAIELNEKFVFVRLLPLNWELGLASGTREAFGPPSRL